jgi:hypothetical protein
VNDLHHKRDLPGGQGNVPAYEFRITQPLVALRFVRAFFLPDALSADTGTLGGSLLIKTAAFSVALIWRNDGAAAIVRAQSRLRRVSHAECSYLRPGLVELGGFPGEPLLLQRRRTRRGLPIGCG